MRVSCPKCELNGERGRNFKLDGKFYRRSDSTSIQRFRCLDCGASFSRATYQACYRQKKRHKNLLLKELLCSGVSQRRAARILRLHRTTVVRKFLFLALEAMFELRKGNLARAKCRVVEFDDLETFEKTKCKPLSVTIAVESRTRRILAFSVSRMRAKGPLSLKASARYGPRADERKHGRQRMLRELKPLLHEDLTLITDSNPHYPNDVKRYFPNAKHRTVMGKRGSLGGQGELKKTKFDPLFSLNHTCAMLRANINRLFRKTWCTTKRSDRLYAHIALYAAYHNVHLRA